MRSRASLTTLTTIACSAMLSAVACGGSGDSLFGDSGGGRDAGGGVHNPTGDDGGLFGIGPQGTNSPCVSATANAQLADADLVVMLDKSGSMGDPNEGFDPTLKWIPVTTALKAFFTDPGSAGLASSLQFFPQGTDVTSVCSYAYGTPLVSLTPLTAATALVSTIDATKPAGGTPTLPALQGAVAYAQQVAVAHPLDKTVVVLATDGDPGFGINGQYQEGCANNDIPHVAAIAQAGLAATPSIPTYVIGVGPDLQNLDAIASAGGTGSAMMIPVSDPTQTNATFEAALQAIRAASLPCLLAIPQPPNGQTINPNAVNVVVIAGSGQQTVLPYSATCSNANGWHYDDPAAPKTVELCTGACTEARSDAAGKVTLAFGCFTSGYSQ
jgi:hypothetical protein